MRERLEELRDAGLEATLARLQEAEAQRAAGAEGGDESARFPARRELETVSRRSASTGPSFPTWPLGPPARDGAAAAQSCLAALDAVVRRAVRDRPAPVQRGRHAGRGRAQPPPRRTRLEQWNRDRMEQIAQLWEQYEQLSQHLPIVLNAIATQNATAREFERVRSDFASIARLEEDEALIRDHEARLTTLAENLAYVDRRSEFIRREVMYEARYGAQARESSRSPPRTSISPACLRPLRLNLGSGHVPREGFVNVDARKLDGVDVVADVRKLPFEPGTVEEIYSSHLVEHFPIEELRRVVLPHWRDLLRPGGRLVAVIPDAETMIHEAAEGRMPFDDFQRVTFGDQEYDGDFHFSMFTPDSLSALFTEAVRSRGDRRPCASQRALLRVRDQRRNARQREDRAEQFRPATVRQRNELD